MENVTKVGFVAALTTWLRGGVVEIPYHEDEREGDPLFTVSLSGGVGAFTCRYSDIFRDDWLVKSIVPSARHGFMSYVDVIKTLRKFRNSDVTYIARRKEWVDNNNIFRASFRLEGAGADERLVKNDCSDEYSITVDDTLANDWFITPFIAYDLIVNTQLINGMKTRADYETEADEKVEGSVPKKPIPKKLVLKEISTKTTITVPGEISKPGVPIRGDVKLVSFEEGVKEVEKSVDKLFPLAMRRLSWDAAVQPVTLTPSREYDFFDETRQLHYLDGEDYIITIGDLTATDWYLITLTPSSTDPPVRASQVNNITHVIKPDKDGNYAINLDEINK
jgi:hypothetical protein